jgi:Tfp pilus assembly protein PilN
MTTHHDQDTAVLLPMFERNDTVARVNLLPPQILESRRFRRTQRLLGGGLLGVLVAVGGVYAVAAQRADAAAEELDVARAETTRLTAESAKYAEVPRVLAQVDAATTARDQALATNVAWYRYLGDLARSYPEGVWLENLTATVSAPATEGAAAPGSNPLATPGIGTVTFTGTALAHSDVASWLDVLGATEAFADPYFSNSARTQVNGQDVVNFTSQVVVTSDALWDRYENEAQ